MSWRSRFAANVTWAKSDALPGMPLFLTNDLHVMVRLKPTYQATWDASPDELRIAVETRE
jgi:hypothetical protein